MLAMTVGLFPGLDFLAIQSSAATGEDEIDRYVTIDAISDINPTAHFIFPSEWQNVGTMSVSVKIRIDANNLMSAGGKFFINDINGEKYTYNTVTDGWVSLSFNMTYSDARLIFGGWYTKGKMQFADLTFKKADGTVLYSLAEDTAIDPFAPGENLRGGRGRWIFQTYNNESTFTQTTLCYRPERSVTINAISDINPTAHFIFPSEWQNVGTMSVSVKIRIDANNLMSAGGKFFINDINGEKYTYNTVTDGWVSLSFNMTYSDARLIFGGWYTKGKMQFADLTFKKADGTVLYSLADDTAIDNFSPSQDMKGGRGRWIFQTYNNQSTFNMIGGYYEPERYIVIDSTSDVNPKAHLVFSTSWQFLGPMKLTAKVKIESVQSLGSNPHWSVNNEQNQERVSYSTATNGWINLSLDISYTEAQMFFSGWYTKGKMLIADLEIRKADGTLLYALATDNTFNSFEPSDPIIGWHGQWYFQSFSNVSKFTCTTVEKEPVVYAHETDRELMINSTSDTNPTAKFTFPSSWLNQGPFKMTGKVRVDSISSLGSNPRFFLKNADGDTLKTYSATTDGWEALSVTAAYSDGGFVFGGQNAAGKMRIADLRIYASDGTLLYRLSTDSAFETVSPSADIAGAKGNWVFEKHNNVSKFSVTTWNLPNQFIAINGVTDINPTAHFIFPSEWQDVGPMTVTVKLKIDSIDLVRAGGKFFINNINGEMYTYTEVTNGWINLSFTLNYSDARLIFGGWYVKGEMHFADLEFKTSDGTVLYSLNDDDVFTVFDNSDNIVGGRGWWIFQTYNNESSMHVISPEVDPDYVPERSLYVSPDEDINTKAHFLFPSDWASYGTIYLIGYLKVENYVAQEDDARFSVFNSPGVLYFPAYNGNTDGYEKVIIPATYSDGRYIFGSWHASGDFILSDLEIRKQDGTLLYSLAQDPLFDNIGSNVDLLGSRSKWIFQNYNDEAGFRVYSKVQPERSLRIQSTTGTCPSAKFDFPSSWSNAGRLHLNGYYKVNEFASAGSNAKYYVNNASGANLETFTATTNEWESLSVTAEYSDGGFVLGGSNVTGSITFADLEITNDKGEVLYSFADDTNFDGLEEQTSISGSCGDWDLNNGASGSKIVLFDSREWDYTMTSGRYTVSSNQIVAPVSAMKAEDFLADIDPGIDGTVKLFNGQTQVTEGYAATGMTVSLYDRSGDRLSQYSVAVKGDLNGDGVVNSSDVSEMQKGVSGTKTFTGIFLKAGDLNGDGSITSADVTLLQQLIADYEDLPENTVIDSYKDIVNMTSSANGANSGSLYLIGPNTDPAKIVVSAYAPYKVMEAAEELQSTLYEMTGTRPVIVDDTEVHTGALILVGESRYTRRLGISRLSGYPESEKAIVKTLGSRLVLIGNDCMNYAGTYNAVTMFLESLGCGWYGPQEMWEVIPETSTIRVGKFDVEHTPQFTYRTTRVYDSNREMGLHWYQGGDSMIFGHGLPSLVPKSQFSAHPEWFCQINGQRNPNAVTWWQYCYSNQAFAAEVANKIIQYFDRNPDRAQYTLAANDGYYEGWCECSACSALGSRTDQILTFANRVAALVAEEYPNKKLTVLSYFATFYAPTRNFTLEPNLDIQFCRETNMYQPVSSGFNMGSSYYPESGNTYTVTWKQNVANWQAKVNSDNYGIWEWHCISAAESDWQYVPWVQGRVTIDNQQYWKNMGADYVFYDQGPMDGYHETQDDFDLRWPLWYVSSKGMWDGSLTSNEILQDACRKLYGSAADAMFQYYKCLEDISAECTARSIVWYACDPSQMYTSANISRVDAKIAAVNQSLSGVTAEQRARIQNQIAIWNTAKQHL